MRRVSLIVPAVCLFFFLSGAIARSADAADERGRCFLWRVQSPTAAVYLLGSLHLGNDKLHPLDGNIEKAYRASDAVVVEVNAAAVDQQQIVQFVQKNGAYPPGTTIAGDLSKGTLEKLEAFLAERSLALAQVQQLRPWYLGLMLTQQELARLGYKPQLGIDSYFLQKASADAKPILELETMQEQLDLLSGGSAKEQDLMLSMTLEQFSEIEPMLEALVTSWKEGDRKGMRRSLFAWLDADPALAPAYKKMFTDRNVKMAAKIDAYLKTDKKYLVIVGSGHLVGKDSILRLLHAKGYTLEQLKKAPAAKRKAA